MAAGMEDAGLEALDSGVRRVVLALLIADALFIASFLMLFLAGYRIEVLAIGLERSIPNWYSAAKLLILAQLFAFVAWRVPAQSWRDTLILLAPALLFALMSLEEVAAIKDRFEHILAPTDAPDAHAQFALAGTMLSGGVLALAMLASGVAYTQLVRPSTGVVTKALGGATVFLLGAIGVELLLDEPGRQAARIMPAALEEGAELIGVTLLIWAAADLAMPYLRAMLRSPHARSVGQAKAAQRPWSRPSNLRHDRRPARPPA